jgi:decaprenylphospho-beta-D-ribofuranose 2-oxidase
MRKHKQTGWGKTHSSTSTCYSTNEFTAGLRLVSKFAIPIGLGRSYGDSSINSEGVYLEVESDKKISIDSEQMFALCDANVSIGDLERAAIKKGFFPPTVPGTEFVSIGGAIASNIHGKSHHYSGAFGDCVLELELLTSSNEIIKLSPKGETSRYFWATIGGMGLTGVITKAKIKLKKIETSYVLVDEKRAKNLNELFDLIKLFDNKYLFSVGWIDLSGKYFGRGKVLGGNHAKLNELNAKNKKDPLKIKKPGRFKIPNLMPSWFINNLFVRSFNYIWFRKPLQKNQVHIRKFLHPLDSVRNWNNIYGKKGLIQFQFQIPFSEELFIHNLLSVLKLNKVASFLGVLKSFGERDQSLLGFAAPGWTVSIDIPAKRKELIPIFQNLSKEIANIGGKIYLTKDSILLKEDFKNMYKENEEWKKIKNEMDPFNFWRSDQGARLGLC